MVRVKGTCRICGKNRMLDPHHIISQGHAKKIGQKGLISNPGNVVHICRKCHDQTTASMVRQHLEKKEEGGARKKAKPKAVTCGKCGRSGHNRTACYAKNTVDGVEITTDSWIFRKKGTKKKTPAKKAKKKQKKKTKAKSEFDEWIMNNSQESARGFYGGSIPDWAKKQQKRRKKKK